MAKKNALNVVTDGRRRYISVPSEHAQDLHNFLRSNRVQSAPPEPAYTGFDCIELAKDSDVASVQAILNQWR